MFYVEVCILGDYRFLCYKAYKLYNELHNRLAYAAVCQVVT